MQSNFTVIEAKREGLPALIVVDIGLNPEVDAGACPYLVTIMLPIAVPLANGLCTPEQNERLNDIEDALLDRIQTPEWRYVGRITWNGSRSVMLYATDPDTVLAQLRGGLPPDTPQVEVHVSYEPDWATFRDLLPR